MVGFWEGNPLFFGLGGSAGFAFKPSSSGNLFDISLAITSGHLDSYSTVYLREASPVTDVLTGAVLESWTFQNVKSGFKTISSVNNTFIDASKNYFLYIDDECNKLKTWHLNNQNDYNSYIHRNDVTGEYTPYDGYLKGAFRVRATPMALTPEAPGLTQLLPGLLPVGLFIAKRRRQKKSA